MNEEKELKKKAAAIRLLTLKGIHAAGSGHTGGYLSRRYSRYCISTR